MIATPTPTTEEAHKALVRIAAKAHGVATAQCIKDYFRTRPEQTATAIAELALLIKDIVGFRGEIVFDRSKPDGMPFKGLDSTPLRRLGWAPTVELKVGLQRTYEWFRQNADQATS